ncbi:universal stress protein [Paraflavisolibacter sp. H34]|uniref:universal stress protein n=1 Tax=Huijunlia imazamoxiresistens TaxID=3127457 RepID=UPI003017B245
MKKITVVLNGTLPPRHVIAAAVQAARAGDALLHGVFLNCGETDVDYPFPNDLALTGSGLTAESEAIDTERLIAANIRVFRDECTAAGVSCICDQYEETSLEHLVLQSVYSDLVMADARDGRDDFPLKDLLVEAHCPVYLVAPNAGEVQRVFLAYDGSPSSMYAIKMFSYLFPEWCSLPTCLLSVQEGGNGPVKNEPYIRDWLPLHFGRLETCTPSGPVARELVHCLEEEAPRSLVVMGAYGRGVVSRFFHQSLANTVTRETEASLFIAHER